MIRKAVGVLMFAVFAMAWVTVHAAAPSWPAPAGTPTVAFVYGDIKVNDIALPRDTSNMLGAFITQVTNPIGLKTEWLIGDGDGVYRALGIYGDTGAGLVRNYDGAKTGDNVTFQLYVASIDRILTNYTMTLNGGVVTSYPWYDQSLDNLSLNFRYDAPPTWTTAPVDKSVNEGSTLNFSVVASDANSDTVTYTATGLPSYCTLTASTGAVSCAPSYTNAGVDNVCYTATSTGFTGSPQTAQACATITVVDVNRAPTITAITTKTVSHQIVSAYEIPVSATDPDGNGITLGATLSQEKAWFSFANNKILIDPSVDNADVGNYTVTVTAIDNGTPALSADNVTFTLSIVNTIYWDNQPVSTKTMAEGETWWFSYKATDPLGGTPVYTVPTFPAFCSNNATTRVVTCSPSYIQAGGPYTMVFRAAASGYYASPDNMSVALTVTNTNRPPTVTPSVGANMSGNVAATFTQSFSATDVDVPAPTLTWSTVGLPSFCSGVTGTGASKTLSCTPTLVSQQGTYDNVQVVVSDGTDNTVRTFSVTVNNRAPSISAITTKNVSHAYAGTTTIPVTLTDLDGNAVSFEAAISPSKSWFSYDNAARTITVTGAVPVADNGAYTVTVNATDNGTPTGSATPVTFTLNIIPQIMWDNVIESTYSVNEGETLTFTAKATDPRGYQVAYTNPTGFALPSFCSWDNTTGQVTCNPNYAHSGTYTLKFRALAGNSSDNTRYYALPDNMATSIVVANVNRTPTITPSASGDWTVYAGLGTPYTRTFSGADLDNQTLTWSAVNMPSFCSGITGTGNSKTLSCTPTVANQGYTGSLTVTVSDGTADNSVTFGLTVGNRAPSITQVSTTSVSYQISSVYQIPITAMDNDANALTVGATMSPSKSWFSFSNNTVVLTPPIPSTDQDNNYVVTVTASDNASPSLSATPMQFTLKIVNQIDWDNQPVSTKTMAEGETWSFSYKATNPISPYSVVYTRAGVPTFCTDNTTTRDVTCAPGYSNAGGPYTMTFRAYDGSTYYALPDNMSVALTVTNTNRVATVTPATAVDMSGNVGSTLSQTFTATADPDGQSLTWSTVNKPSFCALSGTGLSRTFACIPTSVSQQGTYSGVQVVVSDGTDNVVRTFSVTVNNRAPVITTTNLPSTIYVVTDNATATTYTLAGTDADGNGLTFTATLSPSRGWFTFNDVTNVMTFTAGIDNTDVGIYDLTITATDNGTPAQAASDVTRPVKIVYQRHFGTPVTPSTGMTSMILGSNSLKAAGVAAPLFSEVAAYSIHKVPGSAPVRWEKKLVGWGRVDNNAGVLPSMSVYGDNPATTTVREGCVSGEDVLLIFYDPVGKKEYFAFDDGDGEPLSVKFASLGNLTPATINFVDGNRYPIRTGAWNMVGFGTLSGWHTATTTTPTVNFSPTIEWNQLANDNLANAFPLKSILGSYDRIVGNLGKIFDPTIPDYSTLSVITPGDGYQIKAKAATPELVWMTVPGGAAPATATLTLAKGYTMAAFWDESTRYSLTGYDDSEELASLRTMLENAGTGTPSQDLTSISGVWAEIVGQYDRTILFDAGGAKLNYTNPLLSRFSTMKYIAPGYGYWIKVTDDLGATLQLP